MRSPPRKDIEPEHASCRLDVYLARQYPQFSRAHLRRAIDAGGVSLNGKIAKAGQRLKGGELLAMILPDFTRIVLPLGSFGLTTNADGLIYDVQGPFAAEEESPAWRAGLPWVATGLPCVVTPLPWACR